MSKKSLTEQIIICKMSEALEDAGILNAMKKACATKVPGTKGTLILPPKEDIEKLKNLSGDELTKKIRSMIFFIDNKKFISYEKIKNLVKEGGEITSYGKTSLKIVGGEESENGFILNCDNGTKIFTAPYMVRSFDLDKDDYVLSGIWRASKSLPVGGGKRSTPRFGNMNKSRRVRGGSTETGMNYDYSNYRRMVKEKLRNIILGLKAAEFTKSSDNMITNMLILQEIFREFTSRVLNEMENVDQELYSFFENSSATPIAMVMFLVNPFGSEELILNTSPLWKIMCEQLQKCNFSVESNVSQSIIKDRLNQLNSESSDYEGILDDLIQLRQNYMNVTSLEEISQLKQDENNLLQELGEISGINQNLLNTFVALKKYEAFVCLELYYYTNTVNSSGNMSDALKAMFKGGSTRFKAGGSEVSASFSMNLMKSIELDRSAAFQIMGLLWGIVVLTRFTSKKIVIKVPSIDDVNSSFGLIGV